jgi:toxin ParE1/3/4
MGVTVRWTSRALAGMNDSLEYIALDNPEAARRLGRRLKAATRALPRFPQRGRVVPELQDPRIRELLVGPFRVLYSTEYPGSLTILAIVRAERLMDPDLPGWV